MALTDIRQTNLQIINAIQRKLGVNPTSSLTETKHATMLLRLLNEVIDEVTDAGDWQEAYEEITVTAQTSTATYTIATSGAMVKRIYEIAFDTDNSPLGVVEIQDIRRLSRLNSYGRPRQFAVKGVDSSTGNPQVQVYPVPASAEDGLLFNVAIYRKPVLYTTSDGSTVPIYPANVIMQGLYAKALLEENGGEPNQQYAVAYQEYARMRKEALNRYSADSGTDFYFVPC